MARILLVVNQHPSEAFAISVARETANTLKAGGHTVILAKTTPENTMLGAILKSAKPKKFTEADLKKIEKIHWANAEKAIKKIEPDFTCMLHCADSSFWDRPVLREADFVLSPMSPKVYVVELRAQYQDMPTRILKKIKLKMPNKNSNINTGYFTRTTSQQLTRKAGINPENLAKTLATEIVKEVKNAAPYRPFNRRPKPRIKRIRI